MPDHNRLLALGRIAVAVVGLALTAVALPALAGAATAPPTPESLTNCGGTLTHDATGASLGEPNLLDYKFRCDGDISAYTIIVDQQGDRGASIDDYNPAPSVLETDGVTPSPTETLTCEGTTPSDGINCNAGAGGVLSASFFAEGSVDPIQPYCKHLPADAKAGTPAVPQALVQIVVTDATGAEDGPFTLGNAKPCPRVPNVAPKSITKKKSRHTQSKH